MAFIRKKKVNGNNYFYLVETVKKKQKVKKYLGKNLSPSWSHLYKKREKRYF